MPFDLDGLKTLPNLKYLELSNVTNIDLRQCSNQLRGITLAKDDDDTITCVGSLAEQLGSLKSLTSVDLIDTLQPRDV